MSVAPRKQTLFSPLLFVAFAGMLLPQAFNAQTKPAPPLPAPKNVPVGPPAPQSKHYPILLLAFGNEPDWNLRIGLKGPERFDRIGYPPIPLEPAEVINEAAPDTWTYHAKDSATGALVAAHLSREACTDAANDTLTTTPPLGGKYSFKVSVEHSQIGTLKGCARVATELFPKINNQPDQEDDEKKKKPPVPISSVTKFQSPIAVAYFNASQQLVFKRGSISRIVPARGAFDLSPSRDGRKLLFTREEGPLRVLDEYDFDSNSMKELLRGDVRNPVWSPDNSRILYLNRLEGKWQLWAMPAADPTKAAVFSADVFEAIQGWSDPHTLLVTTLNQDLAWIGEDGRATPTASISIKDLCGPDYSPSPKVDVRVNPLNPDLVLVSASYIHAPQSVPAATAGGEAGGLFLYEFRSRRRVPLVIPNLSASNPEWSRDGLQILFTGTDTAHRSVTYRVFWDGIGLQRYVSGTNLVVGQ
ncbi:MAG TPA: hypothetical protein VFI60_11955 [Candidatus Acidoferrum sp.]|nr:hypothetical protein [Candidatus Acidoferrum sp.]